MQAMPYRKILPYVQQKRSDTQQQIRILRSLQTQDQDAHIKWLISPLSLLLLSLTMM